MTHSKSLSPHFRRKKGLSKIEVAKKLNISETEYLNMEYDGIIPAKISFQLAEILNVNPSSFFKPEIIEQSNTNEKYEPMVLNDKEKNIIRLFRNFSKEQRYELYEFIKTLIENDN